MGTFDPEKLMRENIRNLKPYRSARDDFNSGVLLDANENSLGSPFPDERELNRYPMPLQETLRERIADHRSLQRENVFVGVGSDEAIDLLFRIFCRPGKDRVLINPPTYGMYKVSASINDVAVDEVLLDEHFQLQPQKILNAVKKETKMIFICSPNNPTANSMRGEDIEYIAGSFGGIVVVDEAYIDFSSEEGQSKLIGEYPNVVVLQTLSKAFGLAGIRLGIALADPRIISCMLKVKAPYNVNKLTSSAAIKAFDHLPEVRKNIEHILEERERVSKELENLAAVQEVLPSDANFLLFRVPRAQEVYRKLAENGVIVRYRGNEPGCENGLRLTIGSREENDLFLKKLRELV